MTSLLVKSEQMSLAIDLSSLTTMSKMSDRQFYDFCQTNPDLRIERNANGEIIVIPSAFADTGNRNGDDGLKVCLDTFSTRSQPRSSISLTSILQPGHLTTSFVRLQRSGS